MRSILNFSIVATIISLLVACGGEHSHEGDQITQGQGTESANDGCVLMCMQDSTKLTWTAYKTNDKVAVSGTFGDLDIGGIQRGSTITDLFSNVRFKMSAASVNSGNTERDKKISEHFFGIMIQAMRIDGAVEKIEDDKVLISIVMNGETVKQEFDLETDNSTFCTVSADLDLERWKAMGSVNALNEACHELHKGADGESKMWSEVHIELDFKLNKKCP
ncbi:MAG: hypothetical protein ACI85F_002323 [Bacteroidia bacterium]|jgi:hypothetical protein